MMRSAITHCQSPPFKKNLPIMKEKFKHIQAQRDSIIKPSRTYFPAPTMINFLPSYFTKFLNLLPTSLDYYYFVQSSFSTTLFHS